MESIGATAVISHHIINGKQKSYEQWLSEIEPLCRSSAGNIDWQIIRPIPDLTFTYTIIIRYDTITNLRNWMTSDTRKKLIEKAQPLFLKEDKYSINSGLDFLFPNEILPVKTPARWKQFVVTWSAIYPLSMLIPLLILPILNKLNIAEVTFVHAFFISGIIVFCMVYLVMPNYTRLIKKWLFK